MLKNASEEFKRIFLLEFTRELILNSKTAAVFELEKILWEKSKEEKRKHKEELKLSNIVRDIENLGMKKPAVTSSRNLLEQLKAPLQIPIPLRTVRTMPLEGVKDSHLSSELPKQNFNRPIIQTDEILRIPDVRLPERLNYLRPIPTNRQIDLGELNPFVKDPSVTSIECNGPNKNIVVVVANRRKTTNITLDSKEINEIINRFSQTARIPAQEGIFKVVIGRLILSAIISEVIGSKFIIKKLFSYSGGY